MESFRTSERSLWWLHTSISVTESMPWVRAALCLAAENTECDTEKRECPLSFVRLLCFFTPAISHPVLAKPRAGMKLSAQGAGLFLFALHLSGRISTQKTDVLSHGNSPPLSCTQPGAGESVEQRVLAAGSLCRRAGYRPSVTASWQEKTRRAMPVWPKTPNLKREARGWLRLRA